MAGSRGIAAAALAVVAVLLSGCGGRLVASSEPPVIPGLVSCAPEHPGWYVYPPQNYCYPASGFSRYQ
jgi:hypothetical protein